VAQKNKLAEAAQQEALTQARNNAKSKDADGDD